MDERGATRTITGEDGAAHKHLATELSGPQASCGGVTTFVLRQRLPECSGLLNTAPPYRRSSIAWRLQHAEELMAGNFPAIWRGAGGRPRREP